jgi:hypothetical protein
VRIDDLLMPFISPQVAKETRNECFGVVYRKVWYSIVVRDMRGVPRGIDKVSQNRGYDQPWQRQRCCVETRGGLVKL